MLVQNKKASFEYTIIDRIEAGVVLVGAEVQSLRLGHGKLEGAFVKIMNGEAYLINATISPYSYASQTSFEPQRTRKLLIHKRELVSLASRLDSAKLTLIPLLGILKVLTSNSKSALLVAKNSSKNAN